MLDQFRNAQYTAFGFLGQLHNFLEYLVSSLNHILPTGQIIFTRSELNDVEWAPANIPLLKLVYCIAIKGPFATR